MSSALEVPLDHEEVRISRGVRTGLPVIVALHSTVLGPAVGGLRFATYRSSQDAIADCLRLSAGMTYKAAAVDNGTGGAKTVVPFLDGTRPGDLSASRRRALLLDVADVVAGFGGRYHVAPDVGTGTEDMRVIRRRTDWVGGWSDPVDDRGVTTHGTGIGVRYAVRAAATARWGSAGLAGRRVTIIGFGGVGQWLARLLLEDGAEVEATDVDGHLEPVAEELGVRWVPLEGAHLRETDVLAPCALGGTLTEDLVPDLRTTVIVGSANNQLATAAVSRQLAEAGVLWAPDYVANAGGLMYGTGLELHHLDARAATERLRLIEDTCREIFTEAGRGGDTLLVADRIAERRLDAGGRRPNSTP